MYFRFSIALGLLLLIGGGRILLDRQNSKLHSEINTQHQQMEVMRDYHAHLRIRTARASVQSHSQAEMKRLKSNRVDPNNVTRKKNGKVPLLQIPD